MDRKTTAGPWVVYHENGSMGSGGHWGVDAVGPPSQGICTMAQHPMARARANLIAAAPDLLAALEAVEADCMDRGDSLLWAALGTKIRAALAKAGGAA